MRAWSTGVRASRIVSAAMLSGRVTPAAVSARGQWRALGVGNDVATPFIVI